MQPKDPASDPAKKDPKAERDPAQQAQQKDAATDRAAQDRELSKHPRFREVLAERDGYQKDAEQFREITRYMDEQGLSHDEVADAIELSALLRNDPAAAREVVQKIAEALDGTLGNVLSDDLKAKVDSGEMTEEAALEVSRARAKTTRSERRVETVTAAQQRTQDEAAMRERNTGILKAVGTWEAEQLKLDPDFAQIKPLIGVMVRNILFGRKEGYKDPADAVAVVKQAYAMATNEIKRWNLPGKKLGNHQSGGGGQGNPQPASAPKDLRDALSRAL